MPKTLLPAFAHFHEEATIIGRILAGYGELEFEFAQCLAAAMDGDHETALRVIFRTKGEESRIQVGDAIMRPKYDAIGLKNGYDAMLGAIRHCKTIRNQYAHCHWMDFPAEGLFFMDLDSPVKTSKGEIALSLRHIDVPLLNLQERYCVYAFDWLVYLSREYLRLAGKPPTHTYPAPKIIGQPLLHNPPEEHPNPLRAKAAQQLPATPSPANPND